MQFETTLDGFHNETSENMKDNLLFLQLESQVSIGLWWICVYYWFC